MAGLRCCFCDTGFKNIKNKYIRLNSNCWRIIYRGCSTELSQNVKGETVSLQLQKADEIVIPKRIPRGPTDILKALASTVGKDYTAPHYKYHDDPYFIPVKTNTKRSFAFSKESGRKAARYFLETYPDSFENDKADPVIEAFNPRPVYTETSEVSQDTLVHCIEKHDVSNAILVYGLLEKKGIVLDQTTRQSFLELLCFYNCMNPLTDDWAEERWHRLTTAASKSNTWKSGNLAEKVFNSLTEKDSKVYCAIIQGMLKASNTDQALNLYNDMRERQLSANVETYNGLILAVPQLREGYENRWALAREFVSNMSAEGILPNIGTMNALLANILRFPAFANPKTLALNVMAEMKRLDIEPSLGSYYFLLLIYCGHKSSTSRILEDILSHTKGKEFTVVHPSDTMFFVTAMDVAFNHLFDVNLAYSLNEQLNFGKNYVLIGNAYKESAYYVLFFKLLCGCEDLDKLMEMYRRYVPNVYNPDVGVMLEILKACDMHDTLRYLPELWTDITNFEFLQREPILDLVLELVTRKQQAEELQSQFVSIAWSIVQFIDGQDTTRRSNVVSFTGRMLGNILATCMNGNDFEKACIVVRKLSKDQESIMGIPQASVLKRFCQLALENEAEEYLLLCLRYALDVGHVEVGTFLKDIVEKPNSNIADDLKAKTFELLDSEGVRNMKPNE